MTEVDREEFFRTITSFSSSAWRWECQGVYHEPDEQEPFALWRQGRPDYSFLDDWLAMVRQWRADGKTFQRVRMLTDPATDYLRWMLSLTHLNVEAGDDIRWLSEADATRLGAPPDDFYLLDDELVVVMHFGNSGVAGAEVTDDPARVEAARRWRALAWQHAIPHTEYLASSRST